jgi:hypothetical protein
LSFLETQICKRIVDRASPRFPIAKRGVISQGCARFNPPLFAFSDLTIAGDNLHFPSPGILVPRLLFAVCPLCSADIVRLPFPSQISRSAPDRELGMANGEQGQATEQVHACGREKLGFRSRLSEKVEGCLHVVSSLDVDIIHPLDLFPPSFHVALPGSLKATSFIPSIGILRSIYSR